MDPGEAALGQGILCALDRGFDIPAQTVADLPAPRPEEIHARRALPTLSLPDSPIGCPPRLRVPSFVSPSLRRYKIYRRGIIRFDSPPRIIRRLRRNINLQPDFGAFRQTKQRWKPSSGGTDRRLGNCIDKILSGCNTQIGKKPLHVYAKSSVMFVNRAPVFRFSADPEFAGASQ